MVRDVIGASRQNPMILGYEEVPAASNIFGVGMMRHGVTGQAWSIHGEILEVN